MPNHGHYGNTRGVKWDEDLQGFTLKCDDCMRHGNTQTYWLLTRDFWNPKSMQRCLACNLDKKRRDAREKRRDPAIREAHRIRSAEYYIENKRTVNMKHVVYMREYRKREKERSGGVS